MLESAYTNKLWIEYEEIFREENTMKKLFQNLLTVLLLTTMVACSTGSSTEAAKTTEATEATKTSESSETASADEKSTEKDITVGICLSDHTNVSFIAMLNAAEEYAKENGHITIIQQDGKSDANTMVSAIENFISSGVDAIIYQNSFPEVTGDVIKEAVDAGIVVIAYETANEDATVSWVSDNETIGRAIGNMAGEWINANVDGKGKVCIICNDSIEFLKTRGDAIVKGIQEIAPNSEIVVRQPARAITDGYTLAETLLVSNPEINCYAGTGDAAMVGVSQAYQAAGWTNPLGTFGADCSDEAVEAMKEKGSFMTGSLNLNLTGEIVKMLKTIEKLCNGDTDVENYVVMQGVCVTKDNVNEYFPD